MLAFDCWFSCDDNDPRVCYLHFEGFRKGYFDNIYDFMLTKNMCFLIWKISYGAILYG